MLQITIFNSALVIVYILETGAIGIALYYKNKLLSDFHLMGFTDSGRKNLFSVVLNKNEFMNA